MKKTAGVAGFVVGGLFLAFAFYQVSWGAFLDTVEAIRVGWVAMAAIALLLSMFLRSVRWQLVTGLPWADWPRVWEAACIGYLGTAIYPARAGDFLRIFRLQQLTGIGGGLAIGSAAVDRILDGLALCALLLVMALAWGSRFHAQQGVLVVAMFFLGAAGGIALFVIRGHWFQGLFQRVATLNRVGERLDRWYQQSLAGLQILRSPRRVFLVFFVQGLVTFLDVLACWWLFRVFGWNHLPFTAAVVVLIYLAAAFSLPSSPGYVGVYQIATLFALRTFEIEESAAVAYGTVFQVVSLASFVGVGAWAHFKKRCPQ